MSVAEKMLEAEQKIWDYFSEVRGQKLVRDSRSCPVLRVSLCGGVPVLKFPGLSQCGFVEHLFTTRAGGVSRGMFSTMNFSIDLGDDPENVKENYSRIARILHCGYEDLVGTRQTHTTNIHRVTEEDRGKGICRREAFCDLDGLVTDVPGIALAVYGADCVPLYFVDEGKRAIGLAHSGWRGTVGNMAGKMVRKMAEEFGTCPADLRVAVGPSICQACYEVDQKVADAFRELLGDCSAELESIESAGWRGGLPGKTGVPGPVENGLESGKYQLDLWLANVVLLLRAGVDPRRVEVTDLCTCHNPGILFSHRASRGKRGNLGAFLKIKEGASKSL